MPRRRAPARPHLPSAEMRHPRCRESCPRIAPLPPRPRSDPENVADRADEGDDADMSAYEEFTGKSVEEALRNARDAFGVGLDDLDFEILSPGSRGVLGMGAEPARIVAAPRSALGGSAPKREAAEATPLPPPPPHEDRPRDRDRGGYGDRDRGGYADRDRGGYRGAPRDRDRGPARTGTPDRPREDRPPRRDDRRPAAPAAPVAAAAAADRGRDD